MNKQNGVTVYCLTFNHAEYVGKTLQGFLDQEVDFPFHVIVHDDASTDGTQDVIKRYAQKRPELFTLILQTENQYSKNVDVYKSIIEPKIQTEYVCICEGDDYWTDTRKLKLQYEYMQEHPECSMCVHNTERILFDGTLLNHPFSTLQEDKDFGPEEVIPSGGGVLFHTSAYMYRLQYRKEMPRCYTDVSVGDYPLAVYMSTCGYIHYIGRIMSHYRTNTPGSWTRRIVGDVDRHIKHLSEMIGMLEQADVITEGKHHEAFQAAIRKNRYDIYITKNQMFAVLKDKDSRALFCQEPNRTKVRLLLRGLIGPLLSPLKKLKKQITG